MNTIWDICQGKGNPRNEVDRRTIVQASMAGGSPLQNLTINGKHRGDVFISGIRNEFATVGLYTSGPTYEFSWETVFHVIAMTHNFKV